MRDKTYKERSVELAMLCHVKEGRVVGAEKIVELAQNPEKMTMSLPELEVDDSARLYEVKNRSGKVLQTAQQLRVPAKDIQK